MSLGRKLVDFAERSLDVCSCGEEIVKHEYHYFHNNGRVQMKLVQADKDVNFKEELKKVLSYHSKVKIMTYVFCITCDK